MGRPYLHNDPSLGQHFLLIRNASAGCRILRIEKAGFATGASFDEKARPVRQPADIGGVSATRRSPGTRSRSKPIVTDLSSFAGTILLLQMGGAPVANTDNDGAVYQGGEFHGLNSSGGDWRISSIRSG